VKVLRTVHAALSVAAAAALGALGLGLAFGAEGMALSGFIGWEMGLAGGTVSGAVFGASLGLRCPRLCARRAKQASPVSPLPGPLRLFPGGRTGSALAWASTLLLVASPYVLLGFGLLPPWPPWRLVLTALLGTWSALQCARLGKFWPALLLPIWPVVALSALSAHFPCWRGSNAEWCGHMCDSPPAEHCTPRDFGTPGGVQTEPP
jgi:hypothetical protein